MKLETAIDRIEKCQGFDDPSTLVMEAWETVKVHIRKIEAELDRKDNLLQEIYSNAKFRYDYSAFARFIADKAKEALEGGDGR